MAFTYDDYNENNYYAIDNAPTLNNASLLVIPVWFTDSSNYITTETAKDAVRKDIDAAFFGSVGDTGWNSVRTFYEGESMGRLLIDGKTTDWYTYSKASTSITSTSLTNDVISSAVTWYFNNNPTDSRKNYDANGDGYIDSVIVVYAAPDYSASGSKNDNLWAYCYWMQDSNGQKKNKSNPGINTYFWSSYDFLYDSTTARQKTGTSYGSGDNDNSSLDTHTFIHEMGHAFGLDDYYDYGDSKYAPAGGFSMQDYNVAGHDPYSLMAFGWVDPYIPNRPGTYTLRPFQSSHDVLLLTPLWNDYDSPFDEYILVELYTPTGFNELDAYHPLSGHYPSGVTNTGIRVWHVDARLITVDSRGYINSNLTSNVAEGNVTHAFSNTYSSKASPLGSSYQNYNLLQYIRNDRSSTYLPRDYISNENMFYNGDTFSMSTSLEQFVKGNKLNSGVSLGWGFKVGIEGEGEDAVATITLYNE